MQMLLFMQIQLTLESERGDTSGENKNELVLHKLMEWARLGVCRLATAHRVAGRAH